MKRPVGPVCNPAADGLTIGICPIRCSQSPLCPKTTPWTRATCHLLCILPGVSHQWATTGQSQPHVIVQWRLSNGQFHTFVTAGKAQVQITTFMMVEFRSVAPVFSQSPVIYGDSLSRFHGLRVTLERNGAIVIVISSNCVFPAG